jgi:hypothetical protein
MGTKKAVQKRSRRVSERTGKTNAGTGIKIPKINKRGKPTDGNQKKPLWKRKTELSFAFLNYEDARKRYYAALFNAYGG